MASRFWKVAAVAAVMAGGATWAQQGDKPGEEQFTPNIPVPPAPVLTPEQELKTFQIAPGFRVELVAAEPLINEPVAVSFSPDGRLWVLEMKGFMRTIDGAGEQEKMGSVAVLTDSDGDGKLDRRTVFVDGLVMPRAMMPYRDGLIVAEPPYLWFCRDKDGDGRCDEKTEIAHDYGDQKNPEHNANSLTWGIDNWIYSANHTSRYRFLNGAWKREPAAFRGQWGLTQDDWGRQFFNYNSDLLRYDLAPASYLIRNPFYQGAQGGNIQAIRDQSVWPSRVNLGVNRGYRKEQLRADGTLATFTAVCAPLVYRGDQFPDEFRGNVFACEPSANLVRRCILTEKEGQIDARNAYGNKEFLTSTDERFRPVNLQNAPDGSIYLVDMYHGILQHKIYMTSYLRKQVESRGLDKPVGLGRIYRIVHDTRPASRPEWKNSPADWVKFLSHANGWWRDTAQRLLVEKNDPSTVPLLKEAALKGVNPLGRWHALWTLEGMGALDAEIVRRALSDAHPRVRAGAIRLSEPFLQAEERPEFIQEYVRLAADSEFPVRHQLALTASPLKEESIQKALLSVAVAGGANPYIRDALVTGSAGRELEWIERLETAPESNRKAVADLVRAFARCVQVQGRPERVERLLAIASNAAGDRRWFAASALDGMASAAPPPSKTQKTFVKVVRFAKAPDAWEKLGRSPDDSIKNAVAKLDRLVTWPGKPGYEPPPVIRALTKPESELFEQGKELYAISCAACHQATGLGLEGQAPPLVDSEWVLGPESRVIRIVLHGLKGPLNVKGRTYDSLEMPSLSAFEDEQIAAILTYVRREWEHGADPVSPARVKAIREATVKRQDAWTEKELLQVKD